MTRHTKGLDKASGDGDCSAFWADKQTARLIQAAPDLLAACKALVAVSTEPGMQDIDEWKRDKRDAELMAYAAIRKAEGGAA